MKKLFSLMLVAVLLVGVMPFQAFADGGVPYYQIISPAEDNKVLVSEGLEDGKSYNIPDDFTMPEGYVFDYALKNHADGSSPVSGTVEVASGESLFLFVNAKSESAPEPTPEPEPAPDPDPEPEEDPACSVCGQTEHDATCPGHPDYVPCEKCWVDPCICCDQCDGTTIEHERNCPLNERENTKGQVTLTLDYNYKGARDTKMKVDRDAKLVDIIAGIPAPTRDGHLFSHWTMDAAGEDLIDEERVTAEGIVIYAQWDDDLAVGGKITIEVNLNYDRKMADPVTNIKKGTRMGDVLDYVSVPTRWNYKFVGWYWDRDCEEPVEADDKVYRDDEIFAKWEKRKTNNEVMLKIFVNGDTKSVAKIVDMYDYAKDGEISMSEVKEVVKKYYTAKNSDGMSFIGLFEADDWSDFVRNHKNNRGSKDIDVSRHDDTTIYVMVTNAKTATASSSAADSSNPKTGDMIMTPVIVLGASAACLAVLFYLNKKRAI